MGLWGCGLVERETLWRFNFRVLYDYLSGTLYIGL